VTLTDPALGLEQAPVRLLSMEEQEDGSLAFTAEDWPQGIAAAAQYTPAAGDGYVPNEESQAAHSQALLDGRMAICHATIASNQATPGEAAPMPNWDSVITDAAGMLQTRNLNGSDFLVIVFPVDGFYDITFQATFSLAAPYTRAHAVALIDDYPLSGNAKQWWGDSVDGAAANEIKRAGVRVPGVAARAGQILALWVSPNAGQTMTLRTADVFALGTYVHVKLMR
jgi:hypothetical protein